MFNNQSLHQIC